jgi:hypothetical protein
MVTDGKKSKTIFREPKNAEERIAKCCTSDDSKK